ncbi:MAG TPA: hypothetical protein DEA28_02170 [Firmicutes bacterium]|nr:hypothetical protein [Bacillota bacterium]
MIKKLNNLSRDEGRLFFKKEDLGCKLDYVDSSIESFNNSIYKPKHENRKIKEFKGKLYIKEEVDDTKEIIESLQKRSQIGVDNYQKEANEWLNKNINEVKGEEKISAIKKGFSNSHIFMIYGSAGVGKTTLMNMFAEIFKDESALCLSVTNSSVQNLRSKISNDNFDFMTIESFINSGPTNPSLSLILIDECSMVSNKDMASILSKLTDDTIILMSGDTYQIESIEFGNWFKLGQNFLKDDCYVNLTENYRTSNCYLSNLWNTVRAANANMGSKENLIEAMLARYNFTSADVESILNKTSFNDDEIALCLNYDGLYGLNNINLLLQAQNNNRSYKFGDYIFKPNDPILFKANSYYKGMFYNNLKGKIIKIEQEENDIYFTISVDSKIEYSSNENVEILDFNDDYSIVKIKIENYQEKHYDDDSSSTTLIPFQLAYAISIHKAQGLEYDSVKIVITEESEENISYNIFYTAITRAKNNLKIYWDPEVQRRVIDRFKPKSPNDDVDTLIRLFPALKVE